MTTAFPGRPAASSERPGASSGQPAASSGQPGTSSGQPAASSGRPGTSPGRSAASAELPAVFAERFAVFAELSAAELYRILKLRCDVFVVEQHCPYPELDGRDTEPGTLHLWLDEPGGTVAAYLRVLEEPGGEARVGRVVTAPAARGLGLAARLLAAALERLGPHRTVVLDAQTVAVGLYRRFGFVEAGPAYDEDGIEHVPMRRPAGPITP